MVFCIIFECYILSYITMYVGFFFFVFVWLYRRQTFFCKAMPSFVVVRVLGSISLSNLEQKKFILISEGVGILTLN